jgi:hypothetical protein
VDVASVNPETLVVADLNQSTLAGVHSSAMFGKSVSHIGLRKRHNLIVRIDGKQNASLFKRFANSRNPKGQTAIGKI